MQNKNRKMKYMENTFRDLWSQLKNLRWLASKHFYAIIQVQLGRSSKTGQVAKSLSVLRLRGLSMRYKLLFFLVAIVAFAAVVHSQEPGQTPAPSTGTAA